MALNLRKKRFIRRMLGYATNPLVVRYRTARGQEQEYDVDGVRITLPPEHNLPFYQRRDPTYDHYAIELLRQLGSGTRTVCVIDVGANVGDTAAAALASDPRTEVISVEGDPRFVSYLRRNLLPHADRAVVVDGFVGPVGFRVTYSRDGSTGGFNTVGSEGVREVTDWVTPAELLARPGSDRLVVWKSDIDGFDIHVLVEHWAQINERAEVLWFEYDSSRTLGDPEDVGRLIDALAGSGRTLWVYDNLGRRMVVLEPGFGQLSALRALSEWLAEQYAGHVVVPYLDIWAFAPTAQQILDDCETKSTTPGVP